MAAYINSHRSGTLDVIRTQLPVDNVTSSLPPWVVTIGGTADELQVLRSADYLWTTDGYFRRDHVSLWTQPGIAATGPITHSSHWIQAPGRDGKGWAVDVDGASNQWLVLGDDFAGTCVSDPSLCPEGITVALWVKLRNSAGADNTSFAFIFSTGGQSSRGCALYQQGGDRLRATVADGRRQWIVEIIFVPDEENWVHLAISWRQSSGLVLYIDGESHGRDHVGRIRIRHNDLDSLLLVGRRNDYLAGYANLTLEQLAIWEHYTEPWQARRKMGLIENSYYARATYYWNQRRFISSTFDILSNSAGIVGPSSNVAVPYSDMVDLSSPGSYIDLGDFHGRCVSDPTKCSAGLSVSLWLKYQQGVTSATPSFIIRTREYGLQHPGFVMYINDARLYAVVQNSVGRWFAALKMENFPSDEWVNLAFTWSETQSLTLYINGIEPPKVQYHFEPKPYTPNPMSRLVLGATSTPTPSHPVTFQVHSLAVWETHISQGKIHQLLGMSKESEYYCFHYGDFCWSFEPTLHLRYPFKLSPAGASFTNDRYDQAMAVCTDGRSGWISLRDFTNQCPADPSTCEHGFIIAMWVRLQEITSHRRSSYLLSVGAEEHGENGVSLFQSVTGIRVKVVDNHLSWETNIESSWLSFGQWIYLSISWAGQYLKVNVGGKELPIITHIHRSSLPDAGTRYVNDRLVMTLGKSIHGSRGFVSACYDDVLLRVPEADQELPSPKNLNGSVSEDENQSLGLDEPGPETAKKECAIIHEADCALTIEELFYTIKEETVLSDDAVYSSVIKLNHLTENREKLSSSELDAASKVISRLASRELPLSINITEAEIYLEDFLTIVNNLLHPVHAQEWISLQRSHAGITSLMDSVETFTGKIAWHWNTTIGNSVTDVLVNKGNILTTMEIIPEDDLKSKKELVIPRRSRLEQLAKDWQNVDETISIPGDIFVNTPSSAAVRFLFTLYDTLQDMVPCTATNQFQKVDGKSLWINSPILSVNAEPPVEGIFKEPILITLSHQTPVADPTTAKVVCAFWNFSVPHTINGAWDCEGCELQSTNQMQTVCRCYHMTHFAIIMEPQPDKELSTDAVVLRWLLRCLVCLSVLLLLTLMIAYIASKRLHTLRHSIHLNQCLACLLASLVFGLSEITSEDEVFCLVSGATMHYLYLAVVFWSTMEICQLYRDTTVGGMDTSDAMKGFTVWRNRMKYYMIGGWGFPAVVVGSLMAVSKQAYRPQAHDLCWLIEVDGVPWAYSAPCCLALCVNIFVLILVMRETDDTLRKLDRTTGFRSSVRGAVFLTILYAVTWMVGWKAIYGGPVWTSYLFVILNSLQGFFFFVLQGFGNVEVRALLCRDDPDLELALANNTSLVLEQPREKPSYAESAVYGPEDPSQPSRRSSHQVIY
ncbi:uncharacterized protein LOC110986109 [Acanthaster planci]|uniref:Uncharacterized protein LOC110986109 n=1 Tax=Acanthaster planci TaxID=133434 RepID=A0A8B7ZCN5_ACAPL|nr:uncharacterized protein LOC110986109 [Acanthaster planci]